MRLLLQGYLDLPQRVTLDVVLKDLHPAVRALEFIAAGAPLLQIRETGSRTSSQGILPICAGCKRSAITTTGGTR